MNENADLSLPPPAEHPHSVELAYPSGLETGPHPPQHEICAPVPAHRQPQPIVPTVDADRHSRKCQICRHPDRETIEADFLQWRSPWAITHEYKIPEVSLYRHAHAFSLFPLRRANMRLALDRIIERGAQTQITADTIIRAIRAQGCLTDDSRWVEPAKHIVLSQGGTDGPGRRSNR